MASQDVAVDRRLMECLLFGEWEFAGPRKALDGIAPDKACAHMAALPYTIAQLVAHLDWWQRRRIALARGEEWQEFELQVDDWPEVAETDWEKVLSSFLDSHSELLNLVDGNVDMNHVVFDDLTVGAMLVSHATHNAYHLGQIVLLRRLMGFWPPEASEEQPQP